MHRLAPAPTALLAAALILAAARPAAAGAQAATTAAPWMAAPYKDVSLHVDPAAPRITAQWRPQALQPLPDRGLHGPALVWAFATGTCGQERWGPFDTEAFARLNVAAFRAAGVGYILSTGGEAGGFECDSDAGMARFIQRYDSPQLLGVDFDIERQQSAAQIDALVQRAATLARARPALRISFTLATHAGSDATARSLNATGALVLGALQRHGPPHAIINLMVMNYGQADARWCVVDQGRCDMGRSALQAARNLHLQFGVPYARIALTAMPGLNDVRGNVFTLADAQAMAAGARALGLAGVHHWSLDRDQACAGDAARVAPDCHGLSGVAAGSFRALLTDPAH